MSPARAVVLVPNTCGELVQGIVDGMPFLVSCPIAPFAKVSATVRLDGLVRGPVERPRAVDAARTTLRSLGRAELGVDLEVDNPLPVARGFGTSTADVVGSIVATARAVGKSLSPGEIAGLAVGIEPSDSTMFPGLALLDHRGATRWELLGPAPSMAVVVLDFGGMVETAAYNAGLDTAAWARQSAEHQQALDLVRSGLDRRDLRLIGRGATLSALAHQGVMPKPWLAATLELAARCGAYGVCAAHSGTALGLLLPPNARVTARVVAEAEKSLPDLAAVWTTPIIDGGPRELPAAGRASKRGGQPWRKSWNRSPN